MSDESEGPEQRTIEGLGGNSVHLLPADGDALVLVAHGGDREFGSPEHAAVAFTAEQIPALAAAVAAFAAARPTSLPEAPEPRCDCQPTWGVHSTLCATANATPSAPPVAVDPEARLWTDDDLLAAIGSALEVQTGMGETALLWEVYKPEGVAVALRQRLKDAGMLPSTRPAVDPEAGAGAS